MNDVKLRLDYFLSLGLKLVKDDVILAGDDLQSMFACLVDLLNSPQDNDNKIFIEAFAPRKNTGVQPVGDGVPVCVVFDGDHTECGCYAEAPKWRLDLMTKVLTWKPDLDALIKMQIQHDELNSSDIEWKNGDECISNGDLFYYVGKTPLVKPCTYGDCIIQLDDGRPVFAFISELAKPETQEQKAERELGEAKDKPRMKTEYIKVTDSIFGLEADLERGELYYKSEQGAFDCVCDVWFLCSCLKRGIVYYKVETEITWQDCIKDEWSIDCSDGMVDASGESFGEREFIKMCHFVASMTDKPK